MLKRTIQNWRFLLIILPITALLFNCTKPEDPEFITKSVVSISGDKASLMGEITNLGNRTLSDFGFCYGTNEMPSLSDNVVSFGAAEILAYLAPIEGLDAYTTYYVRAYIISDDRTHYANEVSFSTGHSSTLSIGDAHAGGEIAYLAEIGDALYVDGEDHGFVVATVDQSESAQWGCMGTLIGSANGLDIGTGQENTNSIVAECGDAGIAAKLCADLTFGGYDDWFLPSIMELKKMQYNSESIPSFGNAEYYSSTQVDANQARSLITDGDSHPVTYNKTHYSRVRAIRYF
jgi:hypothetical protein